MDDNLEQHWNELLDKLQDIIGKRPVDLNAVLFLIGVQELGKGTLRFTKEQKQDLMHIGVCKLLSLSGYYELEHVDTDGWPHWKLVNPLPYADLASQENLLKENALRYFAEVLSNES